MGLQTVASQGKCLLMNFVRHTLQAIIFVSLLLNNSFAKEKVKEQDSLLLRARKLLLQKKRVEAIEILLTEDKKYLAEAIKISERFLTDQAQSDYETAESQRLSNKEGAEDSYQKAITIEPDNLILRQSLLMFYVEKKKCDAAEAQKMKLAEVFKEHPRQPYYDYLISRCEDAPTESIDEATAISMGLDSIYLQLANIYTASAKDRPNTALEISSRIRQKESFPPEALFWSWKIQKELGKSSTEDLKKYIQVCKSSGEPEKRMYKWDPYYCSYLKAAEEAFQASLNN